MFPQKSYVVGGPRKPRLRGIIHKFLWCVFPTLVPWDLWQNASCCWWITLCWGSFWVLLWSSCVYHHFTWTVDHYLLMRQVDMSSILLACYFNTLPTLEAFGLRWHTYVLGGFTGLTLLSLGFQHKRHSKTLLLVGTSVCLLFFLLVSIPQILPSLSSCYHRHMWGQFLTVLGIVGVYMFPDNDQGYWLGSHDALHLLSVVAILNFTQLNEDLLRAWLCHI